MMRHRWNPSSRYGDWSCAAMRFEADSKSRHGTYAPTKRPRGSFRNERSTHNRKATLRDPVSATSTEAIQTFTCILKTVWTGEYFPGGEEYHSDMQEFGDIDTDVQHKHTTFHRSLCSHATADR